MVNEPRPAMVKQTNRLEFKHPVLTATGNPVKAFAPLERELLTNALARVIVGPTLCAVVVAAAVWT